MTKNRTLHEEKRKSQQKAKRKARLHKIETATAHPRFCSIQL